MEDVLESVDNYYAGQVPDDSRIVVLRVSIKTYEASKEVDLVGVVVSSNERKECLETKR